MRLSTGLSCVALLLSAATASAQTARLADGTPFRVAAVQPSMMSGTPAWWRDSVAAGWARGFDGSTYQLPPNARISSVANLKLRVLRNGDLHQVRVTRSSGDPKLDSLLLAAAWKADRDLAYPKFPPGIEGAGTDVELSVTNLRVAAAASEAAQTGVAVTTISEGPRTNYVLPALAPGCEEKLATPNAEATMAVRLRLDPVPQDSAVVAWAGRVMAAFKPVFHLPRRTISAARTKVWTSDEGAAGFRTAQPGTLSLTFAPEGRLTAATMTMSSAMPDLDSTLLASAWAVDSARGFPTHPARGTVHLGVTFSAEEDRGEVALDSLTYSYWNAEVAPKMTRTGNLRYPSDLHRQGIGGRVTLEFVIGTDGRVIPESVRIVAAPHAGLASAAKDLVVTSKFEPGMSRGCAVPVITVQSVNFRPDGPPMIPQDRWESRPLPGTGP